MDKLTFWTTSSVPLCCPMRIFPDELKNWGTAIQVLGCGCLWSWGTFYSILQKAPEKESLETSDQGGFVSLNDPCLLAFPISAPWLLFRHSVTLLVVLVFHPPPLPSVFSLASTAHTSQRMCRIPSKSCLAYKRSQLFWVLPTKEIFAISVFVLPQMRLKNLGPPWNLQKQLAPGPCPINGEPIQ